MRLIPCLLCVIAVLALAACGGSPRTSAPLGSNGGVYKVGNPYKISGNWYKPQEDYSYDETGIASWYGSDFHNKSTANGETYNKNELTAAHKTLPLPTLARVTNLDNGRSIVVRINDRGPFAKNRVIDVSQRSAQLLGFEQEGTAKVRVQVLADESKAIADAMRRYGGGKTQLASVETYPVDEPAPAQLQQTASIEPVESQELQPVRTNAQVHQQLLETKPVPEVVQLPVTGRNRIFIQAGAFSVPENATKLQQNLAGLGKASVTDAMVNGKKFFRVRIGPVANVAEADTLLAKVRAAGASGARTIID